MTDYLERLDRLPPSDTLNAFRKALRAFLKADTPGIYAPPEAWGEAYADKGIAWDALSAAEKQACREGGG